MLRAFWLVCFFTAVSANALPKLGAQAGVSSSSLASGSAAYSNYGSTDLLLGGYVELGIAPLISIQPELNFRGASDSGDWIAIPVFGKVTVPVNERMSVFGLLGPQLSAALSNNSYKATDFALVGGGGLSFGVLPTMDIFFEGRYAIGLVDVNRSFTGVSSPLKTRLIQVLAGVSFGL